MSQGVASGTNCTVFHGKTAGSQVCGHNECLLYLLHGLHLAAVHAQRIMGEPFPACPGIERRGEAFS